MKSIKEKATA